VGEGARSREAWHHRYWLHYGRLQQGRIEDAEVIMRLAHERLSHDPLPREPAYFGAIYARHLFDTESWSDAKKWLAPVGSDIPGPHYNFARAFAAAKLGQLDTARKLMSEIRPGGQGNPEIILTPEEVAILKLELNALFALAEGDDQKALELLREAVDRQTSMPFRYGPPRISKPTAELLGDVLLELGRNEEASLAYQDQLSRSLMRTHSLLGLARATARTGDATASHEAYSELATIWHDADQGLPALAEVRDHTGRPSSLGTAARP
jgi:predicted Zn-dependent protease